MSLISRLMSHHSESLYYLSLTFMYPVTVAMSDVPGTRSRVHTHDHGGSEAHDELSNSIQLSEPKPLRKHRPPPLQSILSSVESS
ncbi:hypothetical protein Tco_0979872 [Tanacetum coccineum]